MNVKSKILLTVGILALGAFQNCAQHASSFSLEVVPMCRDVESGELEPQVKWDWISQLASSPDSRFASFDQVMAAPMVADLNGDKKPEIVFTSFSVKPTDWYNDSAGASYTRNGVLRIVDGATGKTLHSIGDANLAPQGSHSPLLIDIDGDGKVEIIYLHYDRRHVIALNNDGSLRWKYSLPFDFAFFTGFTASDVNRDGIAEFQVGNLLLTENAQHQPVVLTTLNGAPNVSYSSLTAALDPSQPSVTYLINGGGVFDKNGQRKFAFKRIETYLAVADVYPDKKGLEIIATGNGTMTIYNGLTGEILSEKDLADYNSLKCPSGIVGGGPATVGNFDGDPNSLEIAVATGQYLTIFNKNSEPIYQSQSQDCSSLATGVTSFDLNGDKKPEVLYADEEYLRIYEVVDGELQVKFKIVNPSGTLLEYPVVADVDGDGSAELVVVANNFAVGSFYQDPDEVGDAAIAAKITGVRVFQSAKKNSWMPTRPIWNQYSYHPDAVTDRARLIRDALLDGSLFRRNNQGYNVEMSCRKQ